MLKKKKTEIFKAYNSRRPSFLGLSVSEIIELGNLENSFHV